MGALKQIAPSLKRVTTIFNPKTAPYYSLYLDAIEKAASSFAVEPIVVEVHDDADIERAISTLSREPDNGLIAMPDSFNMVHRRTIIALVDRYRLPAMYYFPFFARDGGLISYGPDEADMFRQAAGYVDRISLPHSGLIVFLDEGEREFIGEFACVTPRGQSNRKPCRG
jgi:putative ABC transport system substrate-binding protein